MGRRSRFANRQLLSGSSKTAVAREVERCLFEAGCRTMLLDDDQIRHGLCGDLGFSVTTAPRTSSGLGRRPAFSCSRER
jgi:adenylylsulfate kinase-like enzyme